MPDREIAAPHLMPLLHRIADALDRLAPRPPRPATSRPPTPSSGTPTANGSSRWRASAGSLDLLQGIDRVRDILLDNTGASPPGCPPTTCCCGARAAWARARWSRRCTRRSTRSGRTRWCWSKSIARTSPACRGCWRCCARRERRFLSVLRRSLVRPAGHQLQIAEGRARRRHRGPARPMSCSTPPRTGAI